MYNISKMLLGVGEGEKGEVWISLWAGKFSAVISEALVD